MSEDILCADCRFCGTTIRKYPAGVLEIAIVNHYDVCPPLLQKRRNTALERIAAALEKLAGENKS